LVGFFEGPAPILAPISAIYLVAFVFAPLRRTDEGLGAIRYPCLAAEGKTGPTEGAEALAARLLYDLTKARFGTKALTAQRVRTKETKSARRVKEASACYAGQGSFTMISCDEIVRSGPFPEAPCDGV
jgi:hypothetical protein